MFRLIQRRAHRIGLFVTTTFWLIPLAILADDDVYQATGFKVGEVTADSAIVWTRTTEKETRNDPSAPMVEVKQSRTDGKLNIEVNYPDDTTVRDIRFAVPGTEGQTRVLYRQIHSQNLWQQTEWSSVDPEQDFTKQFRLSGLQDATTYDVRVQARRGPEQEPTSTLEGRFKTAQSPAGTGRVQFAVSTGQHFGDRDGNHGFNIYPELLKRDLDFFVHTGDIVYYDNLAKNSELADYHWQRTYSFPTNLEFHRNVASYFIKDDHDTLINDCWPSMNAPRMGELTFAKGLEIFRYQVPMSERTYRRIRHGKHLEIWLVEGRDFRSANPDPDGPEKTIWGSEQKKWFKETVKESDATFRLLISPTPLVGPDRTNKADNHSNAAFAHEGKELRDFIASQHNMLIVCGDRHWQYHSVHPESGVHEYSCGPASDKHAGGWKKDDFREDYHKYLNVIGGYLVVTVEEVDGEPHIEFEFCNSKGEPLYKNRH